MLPDGRAFLLKSYFTDFVWIRAAVDTGEQPRDDLGFDWTQSFDTDPSHGFSACRSFYELETWTPDEGMLESVFGVVELGGRIARSPYLRGERATILAFRDELPCADCFEVGVWTPAVKTWVRPDVMSWSTCSDHWDEMMNADADGDLKDWAQPVDTSFILAALSGYYDVPLLSMEALTAVASGTTPTNREAREQEQIDQG